MDTITAFQSDAFQVNVFQIVIAGSLSLSDAPLTATSLTDSPLVTVVLNDD